MQADKMNTFHIGIARQKTSLTIQVLWTTEISYWENTLDDMPE